MQGYDPVTRQWLRVVPVGDVASRAGAGLLLHAGTLVVASGAGNRSSYAADAWTVDIYTGAAERLVDGIPGRIGGQIAEAEDGTLLFVGGADAAGVRHDDVWRIQRDAAGGVARLVFADTPQASSFDPRTSVVAARLSTDDLFRWTLSSTAPGGIVKSVRDEMGWTPLDVSDAVPNLACPIDDAIGGRLCAASTGWWSAVGRLACGSDGSPSTCGASGGFLLALDSISGTNAVATDVEQHRIWVLRPRSLELWERQAGPATPALRLLESASLKERARGVVEGAGIAVVLAEHGVFVAKPGDSTLTIGDELHLSGDPLAAARVGEAWAITTTAGVDVLAADDDGGLAPLTRLQLDDMCGGGRDHALVTAVGRTRLLVALGKCLADIDLSDPRHPRPLSSLRLDKPLSALRADATGGRAYGQWVGPPGQGPIIDLRGAVNIVAGQSRNLAGWVERRDADRLSVRVDRGRVEVAEVAR